MTEKSATIRDIVDDTIQILSNSIEVEHARDKMMDLRIGRSSLNLSFEIFVKKLEEYSGDVTSVKTKSKLLENIEVLKGMFGEIERQPKLILKK